MDTGSITRGKIDSFQEYELSNAPSRAKRLVKNNDIVYSTVRPIQRHYGFIVNPQENLVVSTGFAVIEAKEHLSEPLFIYYFLTSDEIVETLDVIAEASTSAYPSLKPSDIETLDIFLPPLPEQHAIASVLSSLDDKIDLLHRQNKTLEAMAETLFRQWFVEEADEEWKTGKLGDIADINPTYKLKKGDVSSYLDMKNLNTSTFNPEGWCKRGFSSGMKFKNGDTLLARITPCLENGKTCYVDFLDEDEIGWGSTEYIVIRMKNPFHPFISYILAKDKDFRDFAISSMSGSSGRQRAQAGLIKEYGIKLPPFPLIEEINIQLAGIVPKLENNAKQIRTLEKLRDTLLPKLMSGEVRVECEDMG
ncbi:Type I restriction-modification system, specificity subunit S [Methanosarcina mazei TMA]|nr:Type I restriction-modification system, specificity subunit S [Methanosarcina mazei TMA]